MTEKINQLLQSANLRLKQANVGIAIFRCGSKLSLRGMLPPKPDSKKLNPSQQTISLGIFANPAGIKTAEKSALKLGASLAMKEFDWQNYLKSDHSNTGSVEYWLDKFEEDYFNKRNKNSKSETTFKDYQKIFSKIKRKDSLDSQTLLEVVLLTKPDTRTRKKACTYLKALAVFAQINFNPNQYAGNYSPDSVRLGMWIK